MSDQASYEIYAAAKKNWRLLACVPTSGQAIEEATKLQHTEKYSAIQVVVRSGPDGDVPPRLLYQFTRPGAPAPDREFLLHATEAIEPMKGKDPGTAARPHQVVFVAGGAAATLLILALGCTD